MKTPKKDKTEADVSVNGDHDEKPWEEKIKYLCAIAQPLATKKLTKRLFKCVKKASKQKNQLKKGVREVSKFIKKKDAAGTRRFVIIAGNVSPLDVISHMPGLCEDNDIPYIYTPSKEDLGAACGSHRQTCMVMVNYNEEYADTFEESISGIKEIPKSY